MKLKTYDENRIKIIKKSNNGVSSNCRGIDMVDAIKNGYDASKNVPMVGVHKDTGVAKGTNITFSQVQELKSKLGAVEKELEKLEIDSLTDDGRLLTMAYFYKKMQKDVKYFSPLVRLGSWTSYETDYSRMGIESPDNAYGALIKNYALCAGISRGFELLCNYFNIDCDTISVQNCEVPHAMNRIRLENGQVCYCDLSAEIGMTEDGLYQDANRRRLVPKEKVDTTTQYFMVNREFLEEKHYTSDEFSNYKSTFLIASEKDKLMQELQRKMNTISTPRITIQGRNER